MAARATHDDVSGVTSDATSYITDMIEGTVTFDHQVFDGTVIGDINDKECAVKKVAMLDVNFSSDTGTCKVSGLNLTAITIDSVNVLNFLQSLTFNITNQFRDVDGVSDEWMYRQFVRQGITASGSFLIATDAATEDGLIIDAASSTLSDLNMTVAFTINSVAFSIPMYIKTAVHKWSRGELQMWDFTFGPRGAATSPSGTSGLLARALNAPGTAQAWSLTSKAAGGLTYAGNFFPESCSFTVNKQDAILTSYRYINDGAITPTPTTA